MCFPLDDHLFTAQAVLDALGLSSRPSKLLANKARGALSMEALYRELFQEQASCVRERRLQAVFGGPSVVAEFPCVTREQSVAA